jgi:hypothetical protein
MNECSLFKQETNLAIGYYSIRSSIQIQNIYKSSPLIILILYIYTNKVNFTLIYLLMQTKKKKSLSINDLKLELHNLNVQVLSLVFKLCFSLLFSSINFSFDIFNLFMNFIVKFKSSFSYIECSHQ